MNKVALSVDYSDGSGVEVEATTPDLIAFERQFDKSFAAFADDLRLEYIVWLAWHALTRTKQVTVEFDPWTETVDGVTVKAVPDLPPLENSQPTG